MSFSLFYVREKLFYVSGCKITTNKNNRHILMLRKSIIRLRITLISKTKVKFRIFFNKRGRRVCGNLFIISLYR